MHSTPHEHAVVLTVPNEEHLLHWECKLLDAGIKHTIIREPDAPFSGAATAIGICPAPRDNLRRLLGRLPLLR